MSYVRGWQKFCSVIKIISLVLAGLAFIMGFIFILNPRKEIGISIFSLAISSFVNAAIY